MSKSLARVRQALKAAGVAAEIVETGGMTRTAAEAAAEVGCEIDQIVKSIVFAGHDSGDICLFLTAGGRQVDPVLLSRISGAEVTDFSS